ncbi:MAG TPA: nuclear transport factor 2 family protein [Bryobacteraceae bacterium]|nr:nuclear transport factor 2 family protein [Bryobacteraceae bacterium]
MLMKSQLSNVLWPLLTALPLIAQTSNPASSAAFLGTWFGSFNVRTSDGRLKRDTAVLVLTGEGGILTGTMGASIDQQMPISAVQLAGGEIRFHMEAAGGLDFTLRPVADHLVGAASGKMRAAVDVRPAPGLLPRNKLLKEISEVDRQLFEAFDTCNVEAYANYLSPDLEFYHDRGGKTGYQEQLDSLRQRCGEGLVLRRELVQNSLVVNAAPGFGAIEAGTHRFYAKPKDGSEHLDAIARFTEIWTKASGSWKLVRVISYDHQ